MLSPTEPPEPAAVPPPHRLSHSDRQSSIELDVALREVNSPTMKIATGWRRGLFLGLAAFFFGLGVAGVVLPGLPATPFLLLTSYFLLRSSPSLNHKLLQSHLFGPILLDWQQHGGVRFHVKVKAIALVVIMVATSCWFSRNSPAFSTIILICAGVGVTVITFLPQAKTGERPIGHN